MEASLDTNVIIHLYKANFQHILFDRFKKLKVYEFIRIQELKRHAESEQRYQCCRKSKKAVQYFAEMIFVQLKIYR